MATRKQWEIGIIAAGLVLLSVLLPMNFLGGQKKKAARRAPIQEAQEPLAAVAPQPQGAAAPLGARDEARYQQQLAILEKEPWGRNPFAQKGPPGAQAALVLRGVSTTEQGEAIALINETVAVEGDALDPETVVKRIEPTQVILERGGREFILRMEETEEGQGG